MRRSNAVPLGRSYLTLAALATTAGLTACTLKTIHERQQKGAAALRAFLLVMVAIPVSAAVNLYVE